VVLAKAKAAREPVAQAVVPAAAKVGRNDQTSAILLIRRNVKTKTSLPLERRLACLAARLKERGSPCLCSQRAATVTLA
jgi:hypothetical protein